MNEVIITDEKSKLDIGLIHEFLSQSYWANGRSIEAVKKSIENSICFGVFLNNQQIGFARIITDHVVVAYLMDVFILEKFRGLGYSKILLQKIFNDERFKGVKKWLLATKDAHTLYAQFGFEQYNKPEHLMEKVVSTNY